VHITELRTAVNAARTRNGLAATAWTDPTLTPGTTVIKAVHITELRAALNAFYTKLGRTLPSYTDPTLTAGTTPKPRTSRSCGTPSAPCRRSGRR